MATAAEERNGVASWQRDEMSEINVSSMRGQRKAREATTGWQRGEIQRSQKKNKETIHGVHDMQKAERRPSRARGKEETK